MAEKISIPTTDNPTRGQSSLTGNVRFRNLSGVDDAGYITIGTVTKVFYDKGTLDFSLGGVGDYNSLENISGSGSAPIPVDFWGYNSNNKPFGHYRSVKSGDKVAIAFIDGKVAKPIVIGVYPSDEASYELINPVGYDTADDSSQEVENDVLGDKKVYSNQQIFYRSGAGDILRTLNGHSFMEISDNTEDFLSDIQHNYDSLAGVMLQNGTEVNPETETAQAWLLVHEDNPEADDGDTHRTRFYVNKQGAFQLVFMDTSDENTPISILEGSKDSGFTLTKRFDNNNLDSDSTNYVTLNLGDSSSQSFKVEASNETDSKTQSSSLEVKSAGVYIDGKNIEDYINSSTNITGADLDNALPDSTYFNNLKNATDKAGADAETAAEQAKQAGEDAKQAGIDAEKAGEGAKAQAQDIKNRIIYYTSISPEQDVYVPGKYLIVNTDTYIADGTIKNAYIEDAAIDQAKIASEAVGESQIEDLAVTRAKIANLAVGSAQIEDLAVTDEKVGTLSFNHMIGETLDADQIDVVNLNGDNITAGTITADKLIINGLGDITANLGMVTSGKIVSGDGTDGVDVSGLPADDPDQYTPYKKALLKAQIAVLEAQANSAIAYGEATDNDYSTVNTAKNDLLNGTSSLLSDMTTTTEFDHTKIETWMTALQSAISDFQTSVNSTIDKKIGTTANGKNSINMGTTEPSNPNVGDLFLKEQSDGTYDLEIYTENGWVSPALQALQNVANQVAKLPKNYYTPDQPAGTDYNDGDKWYKQVGTDSNGNPIYEAYIWDSTKQDWLPMLNAGEVDNQQQIAQVKDNLTTAQNDITTAKTNLQTQVDSANDNISKVSSDLDTTNKTVSGMSTSLTTIQNNLTAAQSNISTAQSDIATAKTNIITNANAIKDANGNISALQKTATTLESDLTNAQGSISTLQQTATSLQTAIDDNSGDISTLQQSATDLQSGLKDANDNISTLQQDATSFQTAITNNAGDISTLKQTATTIQTGLKDANSNISTLQDTATSLQSDMKDAKGNISTLQQDSTTFKTEFTNNNKDISSLQTSVSGLSDTVADHTGKISSLTNSVNGFNNTVADIQGQVNDSAVGQNLITNSDFSSGLDYWIINTGTNADCKVAVTTDSDGDTCIHITGSGNNCGIWCAPVSFDQNQVTTGSVLAKGTGTLSRIGLEGRATSNFGTISTDSYSKIGSTMSSSSSTNNYTMYFNPVEGVVDIYIKFAKLEKGSHATPWCLNPNEQATVTSVSNLSNTVSGLSNTVSDNTGDINTLKNTATGLQTSISSANGDISGLQQKADSFTASIGQLTTTANGVNLVPNSSASQGGVWGYNSSVGTNGNYKNGSIPIWVIHNSSTTTEVISGGKRFVIEPNTQYTISFTGLMSGNVTNIDVYVLSSTTITDINDASDSFDNIQEPMTQIRITPGTAQVYSSTFTTPADIKTAYVRFDNNASSDGSDAVLLFTDVKLEKGSIATPWTPTPEEQLTSSGNYAGLTINKNGLTQLAGSTSVYLSNTHGFEIQKSGSDIFHVDTSGNLTMQGDITAGNISGVNFTGNNLTLAGTLGVTGAISAAGGNVVLSSSGLTIKGGNLSIADSSGNTTTYVQADGTFVTKKGIFSGSVTSNNVTITGGDINMNGGKFHVDSSGNVTANSFTSTNSSISNGTITQSTIKIHNADNSFTATLGEISDNYWGFQLSETGNQTWIDANGIHNSDNQDLNVYLNAGYLSLVNSASGGFQTLIDGQSINFFGNSGSGDNLQNNRMVFHGIGTLNDGLGAEQENGIAFNSFGNIHGLTNSDSWNVFDLDGNRSLKVRVGHSTTLNPVPAQSVRVFNGLQITSRDSGYLLDTEDTGYVGYMNEYQNAVLDFATYDGQGEVYFDKYGNLNAKNNTTMWVVANKENGHVLEISLNGGTSYINNMGIVHNGDTVLSNTNGFNIKDHSNQYITAYAKSFANSSLLSLKTNISKLDPATALDKITQTNIYDYQYKSDVANGSAKHYASYIIDDINDVSQYTEPEEFLSEDKKGRDDGTQLAYLTVAVQYLAQRVQQLEADVNSKGEN